MVENFGSYLKQERELRGVPLEEISGATKIHIRYLKALEENSFDQLPGEVFIKGYIRSYANTIGTDVEEMLKIYMESVEATRQENVAPAKSPFNAQPKTLLGYGLLILVIIGLLFGLGFLIKNGMEGSAEKTGVNKAPIHEIQAEKAEPSKSSNLSKEQFEEEIIDASKADFAMPETPAKELFTPGNSPDQSARKEDAHTEVISSSQEPVELTTQGLSTSLSDLVSLNPEEIEKPLKLLIQANEISWFNMTIDNFREEDFILPAGTSKSFGGNELIRLTVGNKAGVELFLNGKAIIMPESEDKVVKDFIINSKLIE